MSVQWQFTVQFYLFMVIYISEVKEGLDIEL